MASRFFESFHIPGLWRRRSAESLIALGSVDRRDLATPGLDAGQRLVPPRDVTGALNVAPAGPQSEDAGASGTPNYGGYIIGEDYNAELDGSRGIAVYDRMVRSSAAVRASVAICTQPIESATFTVMPTTKNGQPEDQAIADFCNECLFGTRQMDRPWSAVLKNLLLKLAYGFGMAEKTWRVADDNTVRFRRLAPRLPKTVYRWIVDDRGELQKVIQLAIKGSTYGYWEMDASNLIVTVHEMQGDNYFGRSILRSAYLHYFYLMDAYRIDGVRTSRYGVGVPVATIDKSAKLNEQQLGKIDQVLKGLTSHERSYIRTTTDVTFDILTPKGPGGSTEVRNSIDHHTAMISRNILSDFLHAKEAGVTGGSTRTRTLADIFFSTLESVANEIVEDVNQQALRQLCDVNFTMQGREYPKLSVSGVSDVDMGALVEELSKLGAPDFITPDDSIEEALRKKLKLPPMTAEQHGRKRNYAKPALTVPFGGTPGGAPPAASPPPKPADEATPGVTVTDEPKALRWTDPMTQRIYGRRPTDLELAIFDLRAVPDRLDRAAQALAAAIVAIRKAQLASLASQIAKKDARPTGDFTDIRPDQYHIPLRTEVEKTIKQHQVGMLAYGARQVMAELRRQGATIPPGHLAALSAHGGFDDVMTRRLDGELITLAPPKTNPTPGRGKQAAKSAMVTSAKVMAERLNDAWFNRTMDEAVRQRRAGIQGAALETAVIDALTPDLDAYVLRESKAEMNEAFDIGRALEATDLSDEIESCIYSSVLDQNTCGPCDEADGTETTIDSDLYYELMPPNKDCEGLDNCRCVWLYLMLERTV